MPPPTSCLQNCASMCATSARFLIAGSNLHTHTCAACKQVRVRLARYRMLQGRGCQWACYPITYVHGCNQVRCVRADTGNCSHAGASQPDP